MIDLPLSIPYHQLLRGYTRAIVCQKVCRSMVKGDSIDLYAFKVDQTYSKTICTGYEGLPLLSDRMLASDVKGKGGGEIINKRVPDYW